MSKPRSQALIKAIEMVANGVTVYRAAKDTGITQSCIHRAIKLDTKVVCVTCGK